MGRERPEDSGAAAPIYTTSVTSTIGRPPRKFYFILQVAVFTATVALAVAGRSYDGAAMKDLPIPADFLVKAGKMMTHPAALAGASFMVIGLGLLALKGVIDGFLKILIWLNVLWLVVFIGASTAKWWMPLVRGDP